MPPETATDEAPRPTAAAINAQIRAFTRGRYVWPREALAELGQLQAEYLAAARAEAALSRDDVTEVA